MEESAHKNVYCKHGPVNADTRVLPRHLHAFSRRDDEKAGQTFLFACFTYATFPT